MAVEYLLTEDGFKLLGEAVDDVGNDVHLLLETSAISTTLAVASELDTPGDGVGLHIAGHKEYYVQEEDNVSRFTLEDGSGSLLIEVSGTYFSLNTVTETDSARALVETRAYRLGTVSETDSAVALVVTKTIHKTLSVITETDTAVALVVTKTIHKTLDVVTETDTAVALSLTHAFHFTLDVVVEVDSAELLSVVPNVSFHPLRDGSLTGERYLYGWAIRRRHRPLR